MAATNTSSAPAPKRQRLEVPIFGAEHAPLAVSLGAGRLELNAAGSYESGGTTPSLSELSSLIASLPSDADAATIPIRIMIRPRGPPPPPSQDFIYSPIEFDAMRQSIAQFKHSGLLRADCGDGFVFGVLRRRDDDGAVEIDAKRNAELMALAWPYKSVLHRAFDEVVGGFGAGAEGGEDEDDAVKGALAAVKMCMFEGVLTSGGPGNARENAERIGRVVTLAAGWEGGEDHRPVEVIVGGGVRSVNVEGLMGGLVKGSRDITGGMNIGMEDIYDEVWFHSSCLSARGGALVFDGDEVEGLVRELAKIDKGDRWE